MIPAISTIIHLLARRREGQGVMACLDFDLAAQDYYDKYWKDFWKRLHEKHAVPTAGQK